MKMILPLFYLLLCFGKIYCQPTPTDSSKSQRVFPLLKKIVVQAELAGQELPLPFGINVSTYQQKQSMDIKKVTIGDQNIQADGEFLDLKGSKISNSTFTSQLRGDLWVLPFLNVYGMVGQVTTYNNIELLVNIEIPPIPGLTTGDVKTIERNEIAEINGGVAGGGAVLAFGYKKVFANVNVSFARTFLNEIKSKQDAFVLFPMVGYTSKFANLFVATMYQNKGQSNNGSFTSENGVLTNYNVEFESKDWNIIVGLNKTINHWSVNFMLGFGPRTNGLIEVGYRL